ncbi:MAG: nuclear transport factor 2 family protein [Gemmatimonadales bacterium]
MACSSGRTPPGVQPTAQDTAVLGTVQRFFDAMAARNISEARAVLDSTGALVVVSSTASGGRLISRRPAAEFLKSLEVGTARYLERMWNPVVRVHGPIASVWTPYDFHVDGKFSHCGVDIFDLIETKQGWVITGATYTVERTGCAPSPLGTP